MKNILRRMFAGKRLIDYALGNDPQKFIDELLRAQVHLVGLAEQPGLDPDQLTEDTLLAYIEKYSKFDDADFTSMTAEHMGGNALLVFTTEEHRERYTGVYSQEADRVFAFQTVTVDGDSLPDIAVNFRGIVLNPASDESHILTPEQFELLRSHASANKIW